MLRHCGRVLRQQWAFRCTQQCHWEQALSTQTASPGPVPAGHQESDLSPTACHIGLGRRRSLLLRTDVRLHSPKGDHSLHEVLQGVRAVVFGVPDMGKVCAEQHVPSYLRNTAELGSAGVDKVVCLAVASPAAVQEWAAKVGINGEKAVALADSDSSFSRLLGVEICDAKEGEPKTQRYAALVEDGILLKLMVEKSIADVKESSAESMMQVIKDLQSLKEA